MEELESCGPRPPSSGVCDHTGPVQKEAVAQGRRGGLMWGPHCFPEVGGASLAWLGYSRDSSERAKGPRPGPLSGAAGRPGSPVCSALHLGLVRDGPGPPSHPREVWSHPPTRPTGPEGLQTPSRASWSGWRASRACSAPSAQPVTCPDHKPRGASEGWQVCWVAPELFLPLWRVLSALVRGLVLAKLLHAGTPPDPLGSTWSLLPGALPMVPPLPPALLPVLRGRGFSDAEVGLAQLASEARRGVRSITSDRPDTGSPPGKVRCNVLGLRCAGVII